MLLALVALLGLKPWDPDSVEPRLEIPGFEVAVGDAVALPPGPTAFVAGATVAPTGAKPPARQPSEAESSATALAVAPAQAVAVAEVPSSAGPAPESGAGTEVPSDGATAVEAPPEGTSVPVTTPPTTDPGSAPGRPIPSGGPIIESCDGDEYVITIVIDPETAADEEAQVEIVLKRFNADGTIDELELEGDVLDAQNLALQLSSEGNCVTVEAAPPEEAEGETAAEPEAEPTEEIDPP